VNAWRANRREKLEPATSPANGSAQAVACAHEKSYSLIMLARLVLLFTVVPLLELYILIKIGGHIGGLNTILLVIITAALGAWLARLQGLRTLQQIQASLARGQIPAEEMIDGVLILAGGILLLTPGVLTDLFALILLFPYTRTHFKRWLRRRFDRMVASGQVRLHYPGGGF
jgi:UPF0716 protein FxsA